MVKVLFATWVGVFMASKSLSEKTHLPACATVGAHAIRRYPRHIQQGATSNITTIKKLFNNLPSFAFHWNESISFPETIETRDNLLNMFQPGVKTRNSNGKTSTQEAVDDLVGNYAYRDQGLEKFFVALVEANSVATDEPKKIFYSSRSVRSTGYPDWHLLAAHSMVVEISNPHGSPESLMQLLGSRVDWSFMVHGAAWGALIQACRNGVLRFSDHPEEGGLKGRLEVITTDAIEQVVSLCPLAVNELWRSECHHGFGHGAMMYAVESMALAGKTLNIAQAMRRAEAICLALLAGAGKKSAASILKQFGGEAFTCFSGMWMVATDLSIVENMFESDLDRFGWGDGVGDAWRHNVSTRISDTFPLFCHEATGENARINLQRSLQGAVSSDSVDDDDVLGGICMASSMTYGLKKIAGPTCVALLKNELGPHSLSPPLQVTALSCALAVGVGLISEVGLPSYSDAIDGCKRTFLETGGELKHDRLTSTSSGGLSNSSKSQAYDQPWRSLYLGCVTGVGSALQRTFRSGYGSNENPYYDVGRSEGKAFQFMKEARLRQLGRIHTLHRYFDEKSAAFVCAHLTLREQDLEAFGTCVAAFAPSSEGFGGCFLETAHTLTG